MIYFTTFIFTLLLSHIARATPACGDITPTDELNDPVYADAQEAVTFLPVLYNVTWSKYYGSNGDTKKVKCPKLAKQYPHFKNIPHFPYIGGAYNVKSSGSSPCGTCWNLTDLKTKKWIAVTIIDSAKTGYNISETAFKKLNNGKPGTKLQAVAKQISRFPCGIRG